MPNQFLKAVFGSLIAVGFLVPQVPGQSNAQISNPFSEKPRTVLTGNVSPLIRRASDQGEADKASPAGRLVLVLNAGEEKATALRQYLIQTHTSGNSNYHSWVTPSEFGQRFGAAPSDIEQAKAWLRSQGLTVSRTLAGQLGIEFTGTTGQVGAAFHTSIHTFAINGEVHHANISNPEIPSALAGVIRGVSSLNDFHPHPTARSFGKALLNSKTHQAKAEWTTTVNGAPFYLVSPGDFATQYDVGSSYNSGTTGTGQIIGIINDSNIDTSVVDSYRSLFGLTANTPQVIVDGEDPGQTTDSGEAYLDVENAGAAAPGATIRLYVAGSYGLNGAGGILFALNRAIEDNDASILSISFGACEQNIGDSGNALVNSLMSEAAAQGQTVLVSSGDSGSAGCEFGNESMAESGLAVNGLASTPWNIAVGGTDFYYSDYASGGASVSNYWNPTNTTYTSLQKQIAEQPWNDGVFGKNSTTYDPLSTQTQTIAGDGGGASSCITSTSADYNVTCVAGYAKPLWQVGTNVPPDGVRDIPDVSLFASDGANGSAWPVCDFNGSCIPDSLGNIEISAVGGTSASAPAMAGVFALIDQNYGRQGQANFVLYPLAKQYPSVFNPISQGSNNVLCDNLADISGCIIDSNGDGYYSLQNYSAGAGYNLATGLGSVDVGALLKYWGKVKLDSSATTLTLSATNITHGGKVRASVSVTSTSAGTPSGAVSLVSDSGLPNNQSITAFALDSTGTKTTDIDILPGGTYHLKAAYSGDGIFSASESAPATLTVGPENSIATLQVLQGDSGAAITNGASVGLGAAIYADVTPVGKSGAPGLPTGTVTYKDGSTTLATVALSGSGTAEYITSTTQLSSANLALGPHSISASYSGDASFNPSQSVAVSFTVIKDDTFSFPEYPGYFSGKYQLGQEINLVSATNPSSFGPISPTGTMAIALSNGQIVTCPLVAWSQFAISTCDVGHSRPWVPIPSLPPIRETPISTRLLILVRSTWPSPA